MPGRESMVGVDRAVRPSRSRIGDSAASTRPRNIALMASVKQAPMSLIPQSESPLSPSTPGCSGPELGGGVEGCGMQSAGRGLSGGTLAHVFGAVVVGEPVVGWAGVVDGKQYGSAFVLHA